MVIKNKASKKLLAIILAIVLVLSTFPVGFASVFAAMKDTFTVKIENYSFSAEVTLTDATDSTITQTETASNGKALFNDFVDDEKTYNLEITDLVGYEDYSYSGLVIEGNSFDVSMTSLIEIEKATASGTVVDENDEPKSGASVSYSAYNGEVSGTTTTNAVGEYSFDFYKGVDYSITITGDDKYVVKNDTFKSSADKDLGIHKLQVKQYGITVTAGANGSTSETSVIVNYGKDAPSIKITADTNYRIDTLTVDGNEIDEAKGLEEYDVSSQLKNIKDDHTVSASFYRPEYEITINYNSNGEVKDNSDNPIADGGKIILKEGDSAGYKAIASTNYHISSVVTDGIAATGTFDNDKTEHQDTFNDNKAHTVTIAFSINTYSVTVNTNDNGSASASVETVDWNNDSTITIKPNNDYEIKTVAVNSNDVTDFVTEVDFGKEYLYTVENIKEDITVDVEFEAQTTSTVDDKIDNDKYVINFYDENNNSIEPVVYGSKYVIPSGAKAVVSPKGNNIRTSVNFTTSYTGSTSTINKTLTISEIDVNETNKYNKWERIKDINITIQIDNQSPKISNIAKSPNKDYNNNSYNVTAKVEDDHAGIDKVYYNTADDFDSASVASYDNTSKIASFTTTTDEYNSKYYIWAVDKVGNRSSATNLDIKIDNTKPTVDKFEFTSSTLNVCDFGTFSTGDITVKITASDKNSTTTNSGVREITFNGETKTATSGSATFTLKAADFASPKAITATTTDNAGNTSEITVPNTSNSNVKSNIVTISTLKADVKVLRKESAKYVDGDKYWYADNTDFTVNVSDAFGIKKVVIKMNGNVVINETLDTSTTAVTTKDYTINTSENALDGKNEIAVEVTNVTNNASDTKKLTVYKDTKNPNVVNFEFMSKGTSVISKVLNFLTFGNFFNEKIEITVKGQDEEATSGIKSITLYGDEVALDTQNYIDGVATFEIPAEAITDETLHLNKAISAKATDNVGNVTADFVYPNTTNSDTFAVSNLMIETIKPTATITCAEPAQNKNTATADSNDWYADDTNFNITVTDPDSGIRNVVIKINDRAITTVKAKDSLDNEINHAQYKEDYDDNKDVIGYDYRADKQTALKYIVNTALADRADDGSYKIDVVVTDNAGNVSETFTKTIYKDIDAPSVVDFAFEAKGYDRDSAVTSTNTAAVQEMPYGFYFLEDTKVTVTAEDVVPTAGIKSITYYTVDINGTTSEIKSELVDANNKIYFTIPANFKGQIYAKATDNVDNVTTDFVNPNGVVVENEEQHIKTSHITYTLQDSKDASGNDIKDAEGNNLYGDNTTVDVEIADTYSGIRQIDWEIVTKFDDKKQAGTVTVDNDGNVTSVAKDGYSADCLGTWNKTTEDNLVTVLKNTISVTNNSNDIEIHFTLTDRAGNVTKDVVQKLSVDKSAPLIAIQMNDNDDETYTGFFQGKREATVYVYERNFDSNDFTFDVKRVDDNNNVSIVSPTSKFEKVGVQVIDGVECYVYKMNTTFTKDGDYSFAVSAQDTASHINNNAAANHKVKDAVVKYSSDKTDDYVAQNDTDRNIDTNFTIDNTKPVVSVSYDNNDVRNDKYFNNHRTATITVTEHNFTTTDNRITYIRTSTKDGSDITKPKVSSWSQKGNTYTATINYNAEGDYTFGIDVVDKAGNELKDKDVTYSGKATKDFTVDTTIDKPIITGVKNGNSYKDSVLPKIDFSDINFKDHKIVLTRTRKDEINKDVTSEFINISTNNKGGSFSANEETFKKVQENDGIYTLSVEITDKAENTSSEQVTFTVNRFGSVYTLGSFLISDLNNKYVQSVNEDIVITEYNPDKLVKGSLDVVVTRDGSPVDYKDGELRISPVVNEFAKIGDSGWYEYQYTISKNVFLDSNGNPADGIYKVYVGSEDTVGNKSENISYEDCEVMFRLDHTPPTIKSVSGLEKKIVNADELNVSYEIFDAIGIDEIVVEYYGKDGNRVTDRIASNGDNKENLTDVLSDLTSYSGKFTIGSSNGPENVRIYIKDLADNVTDTNDEDFDIDSIDFNRQITVSTNFFVRWYANKGLFWGSIAAIVVAGGTLAFFIAAKRRKKDDERTEEIRRNARGSQD
ncbi:MAG: carboxypeptidase-like regulatory domain-containing protein [Eubacterium sp.]